MIHNPRLNPFDLSPRTIINRYTTQHKENLQTLRNTIQNKKAYKCNTKLQGSELVQTDRTIFVRIESRKPKNYPKFKETIVISDKNKVSTQKQNQKTTKKNTKSLSLQNKDEDSNLLISLILIISRMTINDPVSSIAIFEKLGEQVQTIDRYHTFIYK